MIQAMSHSLGQVVWVAILVARDVLRCWLASLRQAFESNSKTNFLIPRRSWELLSVFKTRSVAPWQLSLLSSDRHSCMSLRDWRGSAIVRNVYIQQPMDSPSELTLERRVSFRVRNSRRACAVRVTVLGLCVCVCLCVSVTQISLFTCLFVPQMKLVSPADEGRKF